MQILYRGGYFQGDDKQINLAKLYLLYRLRTNSDDKSCMNRIRKMEEALLAEDSVVVRRNVGAVRMSYFSWLENGNRILRQIHETDMNTESEISEENYVLYWNLARIFFLIKQYDKAEKLLRRLIPWLMGYHRFRFLAEALFVQAMTDWERGNHARALRYVLESFISNGQYRYVKLYTDYGNRGREVLQEYIEWRKKNSVEGWHRKKKYNYGNVRNMPEEDYLEFLLRTAKRQSGTGMEKSISQTPEESLTMMETVILKNISQGRTNAEICAELNLKLSTVKSHIYSLYKKLGVNTRIQATLKGKELGILK